MKNKQGSSNSEDAGLTLIECMVAIAVIAITTAMIAPMMIFAVATRVQNQKTEQAVQLAQAEIDKIRRVVEQGGDYGDRLAALSLVPVDVVSTPVDVIAPDAFIPNATITASTATTEEHARRVDVDGDGSTDFAIQLFRTRGIEVLPQSADVVLSTPVVFDIGVRIYDSRAENNVSSLLTEDAGLAFTSGEGDRSRQPLAVLYSQITQGDRDAALCQYWTYTGSTPDALQCN
ncbi:MAG: prepilin-type N-terminal cleavage/methylation domain-containing protein [Cyanobacteria bacterium J06649_4]